MHRFKIGATDLCHFAIALPYLREVVGFTYMDGSHNDRLCLTTKRDSWEGREEITPDHDLSPWLVCKNEEVGRKLWVFLLLRLLNRPLTRVLTTRILKKAYPTVLNILED